MSHFNFQNLSPKEFESLAKDVMQRLLGVSLFRYAIGPDGGVDLCDDSRTNRIVVQCKRYRDYKSLLRVLKAEQQKVKKLIPAPEQYYVFTSVELLRGQKIKILDLFQLYMVSEANIIDGIAIEDFFNNPQNYDLIANYKKLFVAYPEGYSKQDESVCKSRYIINFTHQNMDQNYSVPDEVKNEGKDSLSGLISPIPTWIVGDHGMGKTTYMIHLINREIIRPAFPDKSIIWVEYSKNFTASLKTSIENAGLNLSDIKLSDCIVFVDNADASAAHEIEQEQNTHHFCCVISVCAYHGSAAVRLGRDIKLAEKIMQGELGIYWFDQKNDLLKKIVQKTNGHPYVASLLGCQIRNHLDDNIPLSQYYQTLEREGFSMRGKNDMESIAEALAKRFSQDYSELESEAQEILKGFCLLDDNDFYVYPARIHWKEAKLPIFAALHKKGFLERNEENGYYMHEIMRSVVKTLAGGIHYEDVRELVKALGTFIVRDELNGANLISVYKEVMLAFALFSSLSGKNFWKKEAFESYESEPEYAWMTHNIFSAFDDFNNDLAYEGSKYAVKLCELSYREKRLPLIMLASSYNSFGYIPCAYNKIGMSVSQTLALVTENYHFLSKARETVGALYLKDARRKQLEAKIISNFGGIWQRILRVFRKAKEDNQYPQLLEYIKAHQTDTEEIAEIWQSLSSIIETAPNEEAGYQSALAHIKSCEEMHYQLAYEIRKELYDHYDCEDDEKRLRRKQLAKTTFVLATKNYYNGDYDGAISLHLQAIDMFKLLESDGVNLDRDLFISYSRTANTYFNLAKKTHCALTLFDAVHYFNSAYIYLEKLYGKNSTGELTFLFDYLRAASDLRNYDSKFSLFFDEKDTGIDIIVSKLRTRALTEINDSNINARARSDKLKELDLISFQSKASDYYKI
ncbi:MAG: restriction endonuclease [Oscillospiraceae bacterium]|nr:restriction endonuclease [Oscillospiraceae bacterium]